MHDILALVAKRSRQICAFPREISFLQHLYLSISNIRNECKFFRFSMAFRILRSSTLISSCHVLVTLGYRAFSITYSMHL